MARPASQQRLVEIVVRLKLREGTDSDLIDMLQNSDNRAGMVKKALRGNAPMRTLAAGIDEREELDNILDDLVEF